MRLRSWFNSIPEVQLSSNQELVFYARRVESQLHSFRLALLLTAVLNTLFGAWDYYLDPSSFPSNFYIRGAGSLLAAASAWHLPSTVSAVRFDNMVLTYVSISTVYLWTTLHRVLDGLTLGFGSFSLLITVGSLLLAEPRRAVRLVFPLSIRGLLLVCADMSKAETVSHLLTLFLSLGVGGLASLLLERSAKREFKLQLDLQELASTDPLTGLLNRRAVGMYINTEVRRSQRYKRPFSVILFDIDHFKQVNDRLGHGAGDQVLAGLSRLCQANLRSTDLAARWGGEEFLVVLPETALSDALILAERLRASVEEGKFPTESGPVHITISLGLAQLSEAESWESLCERADQGLYAAKRNGRNQCQLMSASPGL